MEEAKKPMGWKELYLKEDWWAIYLGLGIVIAAIVFFYTGNPFLKSLSVLPPGWTDFKQITEHFSTNIGWYALQFIFWFSVFSISTRILGFKQSEYIPSFIFLYILSIITFIIGEYKPLNNYGFEAPLVALLIGLFISNTIRLPKWMDSGFRVEYYIKTGIVLLGATLPFTLVIWAGPIAFLQATIISVVTCLTIYFIPYFSRFLNLHPATVGAWVGSSEFADAAGFAAAVAYGKMVGNEEAAVRAFTLMKGIGRDIWLGIWSFAFALIACLKWEKEESGARPKASEIWWRFPKFVLGFFVASVVITIIASGYSLQDYEKILKPELIKPIKSLRSWAFIFCFLSIGLTTRFRELASAGKKPFWAFTIGVVVNATLGFILSVLVFGSFWISKIAQ